MMTESDSLIHNDYYINRSRSSYVPMGLSILKLSITHETVLMHRFMMQYMVI
jgi:hypothetical protein